MRGCCFFFFPKRASDLDDVVEIIKRMLLKSKQVMLICWLALALRSGCKNLRLITLFWHLFTNNCHCYSIQVLVSRSVRPSSVSLGNFGSQRVTPTTSPNNSIETLTAGVSHSFPNQYTAIANLSASRLSMDRVSHSFTGSHTFHPSPTVARCCSSYKVESSRQLSVIAAFVVE